MSNVIINQGKCEKLDNELVVDFPFELDHFQKFGVNAIEKDHNVMVTAHTGSGKTLLADYSIARTILVKKKKCVYLSPIKALSNQICSGYRRKFERFGIPPEEVGILTGDIKSNPDAKLLVMTTEILRNSLFKMKDVGVTKDTDLPDDLLDELGLVVIDEVHYINDKGRGQAWEDVLTMLDPKIQLVMLSATVNKPEDFCQWLYQIKKVPINLIPTSHRVVPLEFSVYDDEKLCPIMSSNGVFDGKSYDEVVKDYRKSIKGKHPVKKSMINRLVAYLKKNHKVPAIFFCLSRKKCESFAHSITYNMLSSEESKEIEKLFFKYTKDYTDTHESLNQFQDIKKQLLKGVVYHHSGLVPILKEVIELIFTKGLLKILFATETFAVGVNAPAKTVVMMEVEKYTEGGRRSLTSSEFKQMAGRAGRRGMDKVGYVVYAPVYNMPSHQQMRNIMTGKPDTIKSQMNPDYNLLLKLLLSKSVSLDKFSNSTLYNKEVKHYVTLKKETLKSSVKKPELSDDNEKLLNEYHQMVKKEKEIQEMGFSVSGKDVKKRTKFERKIRKEIKDFDKVWEKYQLYLNQSDEQKQVEKDIEVESNRFSLVCRDMLALLDYHGYIKVKNVETGNIFEDIQINKKGVIASQINECNPLLLTEMIISDIFDDLSAQEIVGLLALFINDVKTGEEITVKQVNGTKNLHQKFHQIEKLIDTFIESEKYYYLEFYLKDYWKVNYEMVDLALEWAAGKSLGEVLIKTDMYEGNFVKNMLKIANIAQDLSCLFKIHGELEIIPKLNKIAELIVRDVVTINSLYLKMV